MGLWDRMRGLFDSGADGAGAPPSPNGAGHGPPAARRLTLSISAPAPGDLDALGDLGLPPGRMVHARLMDADGPRVAWVSEHPGDYADLWERLALAFPTTGLWPVLVDGLPHEDHPLQRPWLDEELDVGRVEDASEGPSVEQILSDRVESDPDPGTREPWRAQWAGLAAASRRDAGPVAIHRLEDGPGLLLVPVTRPADVPAAIGWTGPANHDLDGRDQSAVLRSWEERFGAVLVHLGFDTLRLHVADPPTDPAEIERLAREHYLFCPDNIDQGAGSLEAYLPAPAGDEWWFWWD